MFSLGFYSVVELVCAMPSIVTVEREDSHGDWTLYDARTHQPKAGGTDEKSPTATVVYIEGCSLSLTISNSQEN